MDKWINKFKEELLPQIIQKYAPEKLLLFGSRIKGTANKESDLDIIIISQKFGDIPFLERMPLLLKEFSFPKHIDYICYTPHEYKKIKKESSLILDALEYGEIIST